MSWGHLWEKRRGFTIICFVSDLWVPTFWCFSGYRYVLTVLVEGKCVVLCIWSTVTACRSSLRWQMDFDFAPAPASSCLTHCKSKIQTVSNLCWNNAWNKVWDCGDFNAVHTLLSRNTRLFRPLNLNLFAHCDRKDITWTHQWARGLSSLSWHFEETLRRCTVVFIVDLSHLGQYTTNRCTFFYQIYQDILKSVKSLIHSISYV